MSTVTVKSSTIFISTDDSIQVFRSMDEVPVPLRKMLEESTAGLNSATILIADRRGRQEIARALRGEETGIRARFVETRTAGRKHRLSLTGHALRLNCWQVWLSVAALAASGLVAWAVVCCRY